MNSSIRLKIIREDMFRTPGQKNVYVADVYVAGRSKTGRKVWRRSDWWIIADYYTKADSGNVRDASAVLYGPNGAKLTFMYNGDDQNYFCVQNGIEANDLPDMIAKFVPTNERID